MTSKSRPPCEVRAPQTFSTATIRGARLVGTPLRACAKAAGVPWDTMIGWLRVGRAYNAAEPAKRNPRHVAQGARARFTPA